MSRPLLGALVSMCAVGVVAACSASSGNGNQVSGGTGGSAASGGTGGGGSGGVAGSGNTGNFGGSGGLIDGGNNGGTGGFDPDADTCAGEVTQGERKPLDMYVMFDMSGSMGAEAAPGVTKWDAVRPALQGFLTAPESAGIGVGIQYFPLLAAGSAWSCTSNSQCSGAGGLCVLKACSNQFPNLVPCSNNSDCGFLGSCVNLGNCGTDVNSVCAPVGDTSVCGGGLTCNQMTSSFCTESDSCLVGDYQAPDVGIAELPGNAAAITASLNAQMPRGATPTGPALQGAIQHAQSWAGSHTGHQVVVVLVTDGTPTSCNPTNINQISALATAALNGTPSVQTFVIGVFENGDTTGQSNANSIANAGGTGTAFVVDAASSSLGAQFTQALNDIRGTALSCEYSIPMPSTGTLDYDKVNVEFKDGSSTVTVPYVGDAGSCDATLGGWYYDVDPAAGGTPSTIVMCPVTCDQFTAASGAATVDVRLGCKREDIPR
ncbi:MAG: VWA domain-containing protein [Polyangiaceae bacterium]|nr:VWA domain-containing protein [Polyangiaceae bacterium]MCB9605444.1 VWA domain-containing protein [Polyangiaceae bacterium]